MFDTYRAEDFIEQVETKIKYGLLTIPNNMTDNTLQEFGLKWLVDAVDQRSDRYIEAELYLIEIMKMHWWQRLFLNRKIARFLESRDEKYNF